MSVRVIVTGLGIMACECFGLGTSVRAGVEVATTPLQDRHLSVLPRTSAEAERVAVVTAPTADFARVEQYESFSAGAATVRARRGSDAFSQPSGNISLEREFDFKVGNGMFQRIWVSAPSSTIASDGLGPLYNARSCQRCHEHDGRGRPPVGEADQSISMFLRLSVPGGDPVAEIEGWIATAPDPNYGSQLQDFGLAGHPPEARMQVTYQEIPVALSDGDTASLRKPTYSAVDLRYGPMHPEAMLSPRVAPQMIGLGLLEAIPAADILEQADPEDVDGDGISGRAAIVPSVEYGQPMLGRFGWKAGLPTVREQSAAAFAGDIGISTPLFPALWGDCTSAQADCRSARHGDNPEQDGFEVNGPTLDLVTFYARNLAVPGRRGANDDQVLRGKKVFYDTGCIGCHTPKFVTHRLEDQPEQSFQLIWPYTDLLLHDMGEGLADHRPEGRATGREWKTPPLWGIGLTATVSGHTNFLHDGRARNLLEAVLWHGGEAEAQAQAVIAMPKPDRDALIAFLESL